MNDRSNVSVVLCTYNGERYLREQLDSILNQTYPIFEIIIQDDLSVDNTEQVILEYQSKYPVIRYTQNKRNLGYNENFKQALYKASGNFIAISDQDDIWMPQKIEKLVSNIGNHLLIFSKSILYHENSNGLEETNYSEPPNVALEELAFRNNISGHAMLFKAELLEKITYWNTRYYYDWWIAITAAYFNSIVYLDVPLVLWRRHDLSITQQMVEKKESQFSKFKRLGDFLTRRKAYLHALHKLLDSFDQPSKRADYFKKIVRLTYNNNPITSVLSCLKCLSIQKIYYPDAPGCSAKVMYRSFMKPVKCLGF